MTRREPLHEPHKIKTVRLLTFPSPEERKQKLARVHFNLFHLPPSQVTFDMCSLGTSAMTQEQLSGQLIGDEAYAGARNFERLEKAVHEVLGHTYVCPTHNVLGCVKLVAATMVPAGSKLPSNARTRIDVLTPRDVEVPDVRDHTRPRSSPAMSTSQRLEEILEGGEVAIVGLQAFADGQHPFSLENLRAVRALADRYGKRLVLDGSRVIENAWYIQRHEAGDGGSQHRDLVKEIAKTAHIFQIDGAQDPKCATGGLLATDNPEDHETLHERGGGLRGPPHLRRHGRTHHGGLCPRSRGDVLARKRSSGSCSRPSTSTDRLREAGVPLERGCDGAYILADEFFPHLETFQQDAFSAALYEMSGVRAVAHGLVGRDNLVPVQIPRLAMTTRQLEQVADAIISLYKQRDSVPPLELLQEGTLARQMRYRWVYSDLEPFEFETYPFVIHTIERIATLSREERRKAIAEAGYNTFLLRSADVTIDLLTDSGTSAMSTDQWAAYDAARATPTTSDEYLHLVEVLREATGLRAHHPHAPGARRRADPLRGHDRSPASWCPATCTSPPPSSTRSWPAASSPTSSSTRPTTPAASSPGRATSTWPSSRPWSTSTAPRRSPTSPSSTR